MSDSEGFVKERFWLIMGIAMTSSKWLPPVGFFEVGHRLQAAMDANKASTDEEYENEEQSAPSRRQGMRMRLDVKLT